MWLYDALVDKLSTRAAETIESCDLRISWMVELELQFLYEIGRIRVAPADVIRHLTQQIGLRASETSMEKIVRTAASLSWTRDVFDRMIAAESLVTDFPLVTKDRAIRAHHRLAVW
jgi:PIN domain nuclease of toxin-antitoxin system